MATSYSSALAAAKDAAASQHYPASTLVMVATPIGNLADISLRALCALDLVDAIACEDTRHTQHMLAAYGIKKPLIALHQHNEAQASVSVVQRLQQGQRIAYVSDAGTPGVSDPGAKLAAAVTQAGLRVMPIPGASSVTTLISAMGLDDAGEQFATQGFLFAGFLPNKGSARAQALQELRDMRRAVVLLEAPHRLAQLAKELAPWGDRRITAGRELTKQFESISSHACADFEAWLQADANRLRGEYVLAIHPLATQDLGDADDALPASAMFTLTTLLDVLPVKTAAQVGAALTGVSKNKLYAAALGLQRES
ncbi:MAG: 16S rRNA (cytidine(1402)-2'-O)-methyltransferase [Burkholderiaceae bacterium]|nr:16S rRNA (cytidine(1402)-2'-O)-methyltransferase [Burkholderiaceae bacterium]